MRETTETLSFTITTRDPCPVCGNELPPDRDKFCSNKCAHNAIRAEASKLHDVEFIGVDGEGVYVDGQHRYVMLSVGDDTLWENGRELTHLDIFPFLYKCFLKRPKAVFVGFALRYDFTMWLKSLPFNKDKRTGAWSLFTKEGIAARQQVKSPMPKPVFLDGWQIDILGMKRFKIRPDESWEDKKARKAAKRPALPWMFINDTFAFWQKSFLATVEPTEWPNGDAPCTAEEYATIKEGKSKRADIQVSPGDVSYYDDMVRYNTLENLVLGRAMRVLNRGFVQADITLRRDQYYGPGQAAQAKQLKMFPGKYHWLKRHNFSQVVPSRILNAFRDSFYAGRFEAFYHGHVPGTTYEYDIQSAYPDAMQNLPCLCDPTGWEQGTGWPELPTRADILLVYGLFIGKDKNCGGLPYRLNPGPDQGRSVCPGATEGWYLWSEIDAAGFAGLIDKMDIKEWISYTVKCSHGSPYAFLADMFKQRIAVGKKSPQGIAIKLALNSMYGKSAQSIGEPKFSNMVYASMITSHCRTKMLQAIASHPKMSDDLVMVATDGIYFRSRHPVLDANCIDDTLGAWEVAEKQNVTIMKPGVYWDDKNGRSDTPKVKSRGIPAVSLHENIPDLDEQFRQLHDTQLSTGMPTFVATIKFSFISPAQAIAWNKWEQCGAVTVDGTHTIKTRFTPKRYRPYIDGDFIRSERPTALRPVTSHPYVKDFGFEMTLEQKKDRDLITPDGTLWEIINFEIDTLHG
jgi:hypothetical protein